MSVHKLHFVFAPVGSHGDVFPVCGIARELQAMGHSVRVVGEELFRPAVEAKGLSFLGYGTPERLRHVLADERLWNGNESFLAESVTAVSIKPHFDAIEAAVRRHGERTVVVASAHAVGALWAAQHFGIKSVGVISAPPMVSMSVLPCAPADIALRAAFHAAGLPALPKAATDAGRLIFGGFVLEFDFLLEMFPRWFDTRPKKRPDNILQGTFPTEGAEEVVAEVQAFAAEAPAPWVFFPGTGGALSAARPDFLALAQEVTTRTGRRAVLIDGSLDVKFRRLSPAVAATPITNFSALLPLARGLFHHGGVGATSQALATGRAQVVVPVAFDQPSNAHWVAHAGCGVRCKPAELSVERMSALLDEAEAVAPDHLHGYANRLASEGASAGLATRLLEALDARRPTAAKVGT